MIRHMSLFRMNPNPANEKSVEENIAALRAYLEGIPGQVPNLIGYRINVNVQNEERDGKEIPFTQVCLLLDFRKPEEIDDYLASPVNHALRDYAAEMVEKVLDFNMHI